MQIVRGVGGGWGGRGGRGGGGRGGRTTPLIRGKFYTFPIYSVRAEISAKITLLKITILNDPPPPYLRPG